MPVEDVDFPEDVHDEIPPATTGTVPRGPSGDYAPDPVLEPHRDAAEDATGGEGTETPEALPEFDPRVREDFDGLLYLGRLTDTFSFIGHTFVIRTLTTGEMLEVALLQKPYRESMGDMKAYQAALAAACVVSVDGKPMPLPITNEPVDTALVNRFEYVKRTWFPPLIDVIYERFLALEDRVDQVLVAMGNQSR